MGLFTHFIQCHVSPRPSYPNNTTYIDPKAELHSRERVVVFNLMKDRRVSGWNVCALEMLWAISSATQNVEIKEYILEFAKVSDLPGNGFRAHQGEREDSTVKTMTSGGKWRKWMGEWRLIIIRSGYKRSFNLMALGDKERATDPGMLGWMDGCDPFAICPHFFYLHSFYSFYCTQRTADRADIFSECWVLLSFKNDML